MITLLAAKQVLLEDCQSQMMQFETYSLELLEKLAVFRSSLAVRSALPW